MYLLPALAAGLVRCIHIDRLDKLSEGIGGQFREGAIPLYPLNKLLDILCLLFLFMDLLLQILDLGFEVFLFLGVVLAHHGKALIVQLSGNIVLVNADEKAVKLADPLLSLCQPLLIQPQRFLTLYTELLLHFRTEIRLIASDYRYGLLNVLPDDLFQHNGTDIMSAALVLVGTMGGADEEVLSLFKITGGGVVELLLAVVAEHQAGEHIALSRRRSAVPLLPDLLHLIKDFQREAVPLQGRAKENVYAALRAEKHGYERANKHPKSTKFGRQNPIAERWNSEEQLVEWRKAWADVTNLHLERYGHDERIDHRSHADRDLTEQPTIHEGVVARALEKKGIISDRCEINRQIKADNALLRGLKATVKKMMQAVKNTVPAIAEAMEKLRSSMLIFSYQLRHIGVGKHNMGKRVKAVKPELERYAALVQQIKEKSKERKNLLAEKKETPFYQIPKLHDLTRRITELTEELEELKTEKEMLLRSLDCADDTGISDVKREIATLEGAMQKLSAQEAKYSAELDDALKQYAELKEQAAGMDAAELMDARFAIREEKERSAVDRVKAAYSEKYDPMMMHDSKRDVANLLNEEMEMRSIRERLHQKQQQQKQNKKKSRDSWER